jgi:hypothetical protein
VATRIEVRLADLLATLSLATDLDELAAALGVTTTRFIAPTKLSISVARKTF